MKKNIHALLLVVMCISTHTFAAQQKSSKEAEALPIASIGKSQNIQEDLLSQCTITDFNEKQDKDTCKKLGLINNSEDFETQQNQKKIICKGQEILGYIEYSKFGYLSVLNVVSEHRRKGLGKKLVQYAQNDLKNRGVQSMSVIPGGKNAEFFYKACGFESTNGIIGMSCSFI